MKRTKFTTTRLFVVVVTSIIFTLAAFTTTIRTQSATSVENNLSSISDASDLPKFSDDSTKFSFVSVAVVDVANIEELYAAVNNPNNAGNRIVIAPGVYMLSVNAPGGVARPNGGRLELQENMSLQGVQGDREAVVIDAINLPASSYSAPPINSVGAIRLGRGTNVVEWLTIQNSFLGAAGIETTIVSPGTAYIRVAHIIATNNWRGIDVRSFGAAAAGRRIEAEIVDNDLHSNRRNTGQGLRLTNNAGANGAVIFATLSGNRMYNNYFGFIAENVGSNFGSITAISSGDRFFENGTGTQIGGGLSLGMAPANGATSSFTAIGSSFENNNGFNPNGLGGLVILGGANYSFPNGTSDNTVNVTLRNCRLANNQVHDLGAFGARSTPVTIGSPGTNNRVKIRLYGTLIPNLFTADSVPETPGGMNSVTVIRSPVNSGFDFDGDGRADLSVFRPSDRTWYLNRNQGGFNPVQFGLATDKLTPADYDGDGKTDIAVYRAGIWYLQRSQLRFLGFAFGLPEDIPQPADFDGDGKAEIAVWRPSNGVWYVYNLATNQFTSFQLGTGEDKPIVGDYDGDGRADYAVFRPSNGTWYLQQSRAGAAAIQFGLATDKLVPADYDGDSKTDQAVYRDGTWYVLGSQTGFTAFQFGLPTDIPAPADYDGDGKTEAAVFRDGIWYLRQSTNGFSAVQFGLANDKPVPTAYLP
ncbi:MAG: FG-GAP-like repeat-containing protein [Pyrinomonadaceae bacterium]